MGERTVSLIDRQNAHGVVALALDFIEAAALALRELRTEGKVFVVDVPIVGDDVKGAADRVGLLEPLDARGRRTDALVPDARVSGFAPA